MSSNDTSPYQAARGTIYLIARSIVVSIIGAVIYIIVARTLPSTSELGLFQGILSIMTLGSVIGGAGFARAAIRVIAFHMGAGNIRIAERAYPTVFIFGMIFSAAISGGIYACSDILATALFHDAFSSKLIKIASIEVFFLTMNVYSISLLYSMQRFRISFIISTVNIFLRLILSGVLLMAVAEISSVIVAFIIADFISLVLFVYIMNEKLLRRPLDYLNSIRLMKFCSPLYGSTILDHLSKELDIYILLLISTLSAVGIYGPAVLVGTVLFWTLTALDQAFAPYFPRVYGKFGTKSLQDLSRLASRYLFLLYVPLCFTVLASVPTLLPFLLGEKYSSSVYPAVILITSITFTSMIVIFNNVLMSTGRSSIFLMASMMALSGQLLLSFALIPQLGVAGAAAVRGIAYLILFIVPAISLKRLLGLHYDVHAARSSFIGSVLILLAVWLPALFINDIRILPGTLLLGLFSYLLFLRFTHTITDKDLDVMKNVLAGNGKELLWIISRIVLRK